MNKFKQAIAWVLSYIFFIRKDRHDKDVSDQHHNSHSWVIDLNDQHDVNYDDGVVFDAAIIPSAPIGYYNNRAVGLRCHNAIAEMLRNASPQEGGYYDAAPVKIRTTPKHTAVQGYYPEMFIDTF